MSASFYCENIMYAMLMSWHFDIHLCYDYLVPTSEYMCKFPLFSRNTMQIYVFIYKKPPSLLIFSFCFIHYFFRSILFRYIFIYLWKVTYILRSNSDITLLTYVSNAFSHLKLKLITVKIMLVIEINSYELKM